MTYAIPELVVSYAIGDLYEGAKGFASLAPCTDPGNNSGDLGGPFPCSPT